MATHLTPTELQLPPIVRKQVHCNGLMFHVKENISVIRQPSGRQDGSEIKDDFLDTLERAMNISK